MKRMYVTVGVAKYVVEEWAIDIKDEEDPRDVFDYINKHPQSFFWEYDPTLVYSEDMSDEIEEVIEWRTNEDNTSSS